MVDPEDMQDRHTRQLAELAELGMSIARGLSARVPAAATPAEAEGLALAFHRISRTVRLSLALESRLAREQGEVRRLQSIRVRELNADRSGQVRHALARDIWNETDGGDAEALLENLETLLDEDVLFGRLLDSPVEASIARLRADLGLAGPLAGPAGERPGPDPAAALSAGGGPAEAPDPDAREPGPADPDTPPPGAVRPTRLH